MLISTVSCEWESNLFYVNLLIILIFFYFTPPYHLGIHGPTPISICPYVGLLMGNLHDEMTKTPVDDTGYLTCFEVIKVIYNSCPRSD